MPGIKQIRLNDPLQIKQRINEFIGKNINIVFHDRKVIFGELQKVNENEIEVRNMRLKTKSFSFDQVAEIYFDFFV